MSDTDDQWAELRAVADLTKHPYSHLRKQLGDLLAERDALAVERRLVTKAFALAVNSADDAQRFLERAAEELHDPEDPS